MKQLAIVTIGSVLLLQTVPDKIGPKGHLEWDPPTVNEDGTPLDDLAGYRAAVAVESADLNSSDLPLADRSVEDPALTQVELQDLLSGQLSGRYSLWVLAVDDAGNESIWAGPLLIDYDQKRPGKPGKVRVVK